MLNDRDESGQATPTFDIEVAVTHVDGNAQRLRSPWRLARLPQLTHDYDDFSSFDSRNSLILLPLSL